ncbi:hypothetical protein ILP97_18795 [Amycolatopsis sp. H6(2020)]|nr:hypothetical protein [Amycolatopsis sp. H6(2020)]
MARIIVDVYREQTTRLTVDDHNNEPLVLVEYHAGGCSGRTVAGMRLRVGVLTAARSPG